MTDLDKLQEGIEPSTKIDEKNINKEVEEISAEKQKALDKAEKEKKLQQEKRIKAEEKAIAEKKKKEERDKKRANKVPFKETTFGYFCTQYWLMIAFFFIALLFSVGLFFIDKKYEKVNLEFEEYNKETIDLIDEGSTFLDQWARQITFLQGEKVVNLKIEKKEKIKSIVEKYSRNYTINDNEKGDFTLKIKKSSLVESDINRMLLELKENGQKFIIRGLSQSAIELMLMFRV